MAETIPIDLQRLLEIIENPNKLSTNELDVEFEFFLYEALSANLKRMDLIGRLLDILDLIIWEHRVLWGTDSDSEPVMLRDSIIRNMRASGLTQELIDDQLESAVMIYQFIHGEIERNCNPGRRHA